MYQIALALGLLATIVDNPDPVGLRQERCRQVRSVFDLEDGCPPDSGLEVVDMYVRDGNTVTILPWSACDDAGDCLRTITDACRRHGYGVSFIQFMPNPDREKGERECVGKCNNGDQLQIEVNCDVPVLQPVPPDEQALPPWWVGQ